MREIERRTRNAEQGDVAKLHLPEVPGATSENFDEHLNLMFDLMALAYQGNLTRIQSFMIAAEVSDQTYTHIGVPDAFHALSHHGNDQAKKARLVKIQRYHTQAFARFVGKLANMPDGDGSMLDHSLLLYGSNMSNSNAHNQYPLPTALLGEACGRVKGGQHINFEQRTPLANVLLTMLQRTGVPIDKIGDSTGAIAADLERGGARCWCRHWPSRWRLTRARGGARRYAATVVEPIEKVAPLVLAARDNDAAARARPARRASCPGRESAHCRWHHRPALGRPSRRCGDLVARLLAAGADANARNDYGATPDVGGGSPRRCRNCCAHCWRPAPMSNRPMPMARRR